MKLGMSHQQRSVRHSVARLGNEFWTTVWLLSKVFLKSPKFRAMQPSVAHFHAIMQSIIAQVLLGKSNRQVYSPLLATTGQKMKKRGTSPHIMKIESTRPRKDTKGGEVIRVSVFDATIHPMGIDRLQQTCNASEYGLACQIALSLFWVPRPLRELGTITLRTHLVQASCSYEQLFCHNRSSRSVTVSPNCEQLPYTR